MIFVKRPLTVSGFALGAGAFSAAYFSTEIALFLCSLCVFCFILSLIIKRFRKAVLCLTLISLAFGLALGTARLYSLKADAECLLQNPAVENAQFIPEKAVGENQTIGQLILNSGEKVKAFVNGKELKPFEIYRISGTLENLADSFKNYCYSRQVSVQLYAQSAVPLGKTGGNPLFYTAYQVQSACSDKLYTYLPHKEASIIDALLLGNRLSLDRDLYYDFRTSGVAHIAVVSGMHLSVISSIVFMLCCFITHKHRLSSLTAIFAVICFMLITGFSLSVVRAGIMCIIMLSGKLFSRQGDALNSLGFAVLLITLINPLSLLDVGFQLSVMATLGIITLSPYIVKSCSRYIQSKLLNSLILTPAAISLSAFIATAPITFVNFDFIGVYFLFTNLLLTFAVPMLLIFSMLFVLFSFIPFCGFLYYPCGLIAGLLSRYIAFIVSAVSALTYARLDLDIPHREIIVGVLVLAAAVIILIKRTGKAALIAGSGAILAFCLILSLFTVIRADNASLKLISTGEGITAVLEKNGESAVIACGGTTGRYSIQNHLTDSGCVNLLTVKGGTRESGGMFSAVAASCISEQYFVQDASANKRILSELDSASVYYSDEQIMLWGKYTLTLVPLESSTAAVLELENEFILILPNPEYAERLPEKYRNPDLLITTKPLDSGTIKSDNTIIACSKAHDEKYEQQGVYSNNTLSLYQSKEISIDLTR